MRNPIRSLCAALLLAMAASSCQAHRVFEYSPPPEIEATPTYQAVVEASFDDVWRALISGVGGSFFGIEEFERDSGLLTLSFTSSPFSNAISGGHLLFEYNNASKRSGEVFWTGRASEPEMNINFDGDYADYAQQYLGGVFEGRANLVVVEIGPNKTEVTANQRFALTVSVQRPGTGAAETVQWSWNAGDTCTRMVTTTEGGREARIFRSTGFVEERLRQAIELALEQRL